MLGDKIEVLDKCNKKHLIYLTTIVVVAYIGILSWLGAA
jgi:hypothetical protein